jgi:mono/diheme cytochrome c family protein
MSAAMQWLVAFVAVTVAGIAAADEAVIPAATERAAAESAFTLKVLPLLKSRCFACHGEKPDDIKGQLDLTRRAGLLRGGQSHQPAMVPGKPAESMLISAVKWDGLEMPPKQNDRLSGEQIKLLETWIAAGAPWPDANEQRKHLAAEWSQASTKEGVLVKTSGGLSDEWTFRRYAPENLWAYQPLTNSRVPREHQDRAIDWLIDERLAALDLEPAPAADRRTLIRRATFDLTGLPPTLAEIESFVNDPANNDVAFAKLVERLLNSPHYGEQYARHWLDVVRYADSSGFANDYERGNAWRYRDYVVRAFNGDKPYDQFIREQIAGDEIGPTNPEMIVAAGFLRMGPWELTGMEVAKVARQRFLDDVTDAVGQVFLGHMLQCARCHDHKFDPVPTRDYYALQAVFATTQLAEREAAFLPGENVSGFEEKKYLDQRREHYHRILSDLDALSIRAARQWYVDQGLDASTFETLLKQAKNKAGPANRQRTYEQVRRLLGQEKPDDQIPPRHVGFTPRDFGLERVARKGLERLKWVAERYEPVALAVYGGHTPAMRSVNAPLRVAENATAGELERTCILTGGDPFSPAAQVKPAALSAVSALSGTPAHQASFPDTVSGRRTALADWIAAEKNPLTARVMVNRIWQWHFGQPLAGNPNNFGTTGKKPSHPELLDLLAERFVASGWSIKAMHRLIMNSAAYRRSTLHADASRLAAKDPTSTSYAAFGARRLSAEELRDAMLAASGELNLASGGIPVRPEMNLEAALQPRQVMGTFAEAWQPSPLPDQRHRRSLYVLKLRGLRDPFLEVFNSPAPDLSCEARESSTITPQVFALFNSQASFTRALVMAQHISNETSTTTGAIEQAFRRALGRSPQEQELAACLEHWQTMIEKHRGLKFDRPQRPRVVKRQAVEENTGEKFEFTEPLEAYADFVPDLEPADATAEVRGLAEICLVLFNSNEFAYVY